MFLRRQARNPRSHGLAGTKFSKQQTNIWDIRLPGASDGRCSITPAVAPPAPRTRASVWTHRLHSSSFGERSQPKARKRSDDAQKRF
jgi:hypothetical protein